MKNQNHVVNMHRVDETKVTDLRNENYLCRVLRKEAHGLRRVELNTTLNTTCVSVAPVHRMNNMYNNVLKKKKKKKHYSDDLDLLFIGTVREVLA